MVEVQQYLDSLLSQMDRAGGLVGLALGFLLGLLTCLAIFYQGSVRA